MLKIWDFTEILKKVEKTKPLYETKKKYFADRKEDLNVEPYSHLVQKDSRKVICPEPKIPPIVREVKAHLQPCTNVTGHTISGIVTCSRLAHEIKVWCP